MTALSELLTKDDIHLDVPLADEAALIAFAAASLSARCGIPRSALAAQLAAREQMGSTALGHEVAIPHARMPLCTRSTGVFVRPARPIPFGAPDGQPVALFACFVFPTRASNEPIRLLADAATLFGDRSLRQQLLRCSDAASFASLLQASPTAPDARTG